MNPTSRKDRIRELRAEADRLEDEDAGRRVSGLGRSGPVYEVPPPPRRTSDRATIVIVAVGVLMGFLVAWGFWP